MLNRAKAPVNLKTPWDFWLQVTAPKKKQHASRPCPSRRWSRSVIAPWATDSQLYVIAEIGINHNGSLEMAQRLIEGAKAAGCDAVKFQKRTPSCACRAAQWDVQRDTPWGRMELHRIQAAHGVRREPSTMHRPDLPRPRHALVRVVLGRAVGRVHGALCAPPCYKAASASLTDLELLAAMQPDRPPLMISTGMSTERRDRRGGDGRRSHKQLLVAHATSTYPCPLNELNLRMIRSAEAQYPRVPDRLLRPRRRGSRRPGPRWRSAPPSSSATSRSTAGWGHRSRRLRSRSRARARWCARSATFERAVGDGDQARLRQRAAHRGAKLRRVRCRAAEFRADGAHMSWTMLSPALIARGAGC